MRESLLTIPLNEVFEQTGGCPLCRMRDHVENQVCDYIMGAAMMEPDVRIETNAKGFCRVHYEMLLPRNNRLSLALMLNSHLGEQLKSLDKKDAFTKKSPPPIPTCFVCDKVEWALSHMTKTLFVLFLSDEKFRARFAEQDFICPQHRHFLLYRAAHALHPKKEYPRFEEAVNDLCRKYMSVLDRDVKTFCDSFDYRNAGRLSAEGMEEARLSVQHAIDFLSSRKTPED
ncbi:MAG: DUF6062 family protein [Oscillospiraceae bacterium]|jgi:hypothetical protein|nr:DUF6062 family protein [Oscillospiraceae bacterium]